MGGDFKCLVYKDAIVLLNKTRQKLKEIYEDVNSCEQKVRQLVNQGKTEYIGLESQQGEKESVDDDMRKFKKVDQFILLRSWLNSDNDLLVAEHQIQDNSWTSVQIYSLRQTRN